MPDLDGDTHQHRRQRRQMQENRVKKHIESTLSFIQHITCVVHASFLTCIHITPIDAGRRETVHVTYNPA